jgi:ABC-type transport system involved in cytochrome c biogenesis permease component
VWPIIHRELLSESRRAALYTLRLLAGSALTAWLALNWLVASGSAAAVGTVVFQELSYAIYLAIWIGAPFLTADCLSREKREGTLGLLFLTPLKALEIVLGKSLVHGVRAWSFLFAAAPIMAVPHLMGGVSMNSILSVLASCLGALALAMGAGLLPSANARQRRWVFVQTVMWTVLFGAVHAHLARPALALAMPPPVALPVAAFLGPSVPRLPSGLAIGFGASPPSAITVASGCGLVLVLIVLAAAGRIRSEWQDKPLSRRQLWWLRTFCSPRFWRSLFKSAMRRELNRNPITWLQYCSTWDRVAKLVWCGLALMIDTHLITNLHRGPRDVLGLEALFALALAYIAATSFRRERQNGAFELILVSPIAREEIIVGRLRAVRGQFLPAAVTLIIPWPLLATLYGNEQFLRMAIVHCGFILATYWSLPVLGLYFALGTRNFFRALVSTIFFGLIIPFVLTQLGSLLIARQASFEDACILAMIYQAATVALLSPLLLPLIKRGAALPTRV